MGVGGQGVGGGRSSPRLLLLHLASEIASPWALACRGARGDRRGCAPRRLAHRTCVALIPPHTLLLQKEKEEAAAAETANGDDKKEKKKKKKRAAEEEPAADGGAAEEGEKKVRRAP